MKLSDYILMEPRYKWADESGNFIKPTIGQILSEYFYRINIFRDIRNWFPLYAWLLVLLLMPAFLLLIFKYFNYAVQNSVMESSCFYYFYFFILTLRIANASFF